MLFTCQPYKPEKNRCHAAVLPLGNFPNVKYPKRQLSKGKVRPFETPQAIMVGRALWKVAAWDIAYFRSCRLGSSLGKVPNIIRTTASSILLIGHEVSYKNTSRVSLTNIV